jgi:hypothetical protein
LLLCGLAAETKTGIVHEREPVRFLRRKVEWIRLIFYRKCEQVAGDAGVVSLPYARIIQRQLNTGEMLNGNL